MFDTQKMINNLKKTYEAHIRENGDPGELTLDDIYEDITFVHYELKDSNSEYSKNDLTNLLNHLETLQLKKLMQ